MTPGPVAYIPTLNREELEAQVRWAVRAGLIPAVEYTANQDAGRSYWSMWKLPLFGVADPKAVAAEIDACAAEHPGAWVRLVGYDPAHGGLGTAFIVVRPDEGARR